MAGGIEHVTSFREGFAESGIGRGLQKRHRRVKVVTHLPRVARSQVLLGSIGIEARIWQKLRVVDRPS